MATIVILYTVLVSIGRLITPFFNDRLPNFENWSSQLLKAPVKIGHVKIIWNWHEPELAFYNVTILDPQTQKPKFAVNQVTINLQILRSLFHWQAIPENISISGAHITLRHAVMGQFNVDELNAFQVTDKKVGATTRINDVIGWVFSQPSLGLYNINIAYIPPEGGEKLITLAKLLLTNNGDKHYLMGDAYMNQEVPTHMHINLKWEGSVLDIPHIVLHSTVYLEGVALSEWINQFKWHGVQFNKALGSIKIWVTWKNNQFQKIQTQFQFYNVEILYKSLFVNPLHFDSLQALVNWQKNAEGTWSLDILNSQLINADLTAAGNLMMKIPLNDSPSLNLSADFSVKNVRNIANYLPLHVFGADLSKWLRNAFLGGKIESGKAVFQGRLADFPFENKKGIFEISGNLHEVGLNYAPNWPALQHVNGKLIFSRNSMNLNVQSGKILNVPLKAVQAVIPAIGSSDTMLHVKGLMQTDFTEGLNFLLQSPLRKNIGKDLAELNLRGLMDMNLELTVPLRNTDATKVVGNILFSNASLELPLTKVKLDQLKGAIHFTEQVIQGSNLQGRLFGQPATLTIQTEHPTDKSSLIKVTTLATMNMLALEETLKIPLNKYVQGSTPVNAEINLSTSGDHAKQVIIKSNLQGITINLPEPYGKKAAGTRKFQLTISLNQDKPMQTKLFYNDQIKAGMNFQKSKNGMELVDGVNLEGKIINLYGFTLNNPHLQISDKKTAWQININSDQVMGQLEVAKNYSHVGGKFQHFYVSESKNEPVLIDPKLIPALSIAANDVTYGEKKLGNVVFESIPNQNGMQINQLQISSSVANLEATGTWELQNKKNSSNLKGKVITNTLSLMLMQWGLNASSLLANNANAQFDLAWPSAPYSPKVAGMSGVLSLAVGNGRVVNLSESTEAKMGLGRMLSIFSLQTIPRYLSLDFRDLFQNGYSFDSLKGSFKLNDGNAYTNDTRFTGPIASIDIAGRIGLQSQDYDLQIGVTTYVTGGLLTTAAGVSTAVGLVNPIAGIATSVVGAVMSQASNNARGKSYQYRITGSWSNPSWQQMYTSHK